jgi:endoglucanase
MFIRRLNSTWRQGSSTSKIEDLMNSSYRFVPLVLSLALFMSLFALLPTVAAQAGSTVNVWWPTANSHLSGTQPFKALVPDRTLDTYKMYWQVDGGGLVEMYNSYTDYPHKEAIVDVTNWRWQSSGNYMINFVAKDSSGNTIAQQQEPVLINPPTSTTPQPTTNSFTPTQTTEVAPVTSPPTVTTKTPTVTTTTSVVTNTAPTVQNTVQKISTSGATFYVNPDSPAAKQASEWRSSRPSDASAMDILAAQPTAQWLGGWNSDVKADVSKSMSAALLQGTIPEFVLYNIPQRDCGGYSAGGTSANVYASWITSVAQGIGNNKAIVILEPDAISGMSCLSSTDQATRLSLLSSAIDTLKSTTKASVYVDAGHSAWVDATAMAASLEKAGVAKADGFSLNVSNYQLTTSEINYGTQISSKINGKHFVIDTSRNGNGSNGEWCNPSGRAIGNRPTTATGNSLIDAYLWLKVPGESDGNCNGGPNAGQWWADKALELVKNAH